MENKAKIEDPCGKKPDGLHMSRQEMLDLASNVTEILVDRIKALPAEDAWDGEFRQELDDLLMKSAPEGGRPAAEVIEQAASGILSLALRHQHPRCFGFVPSSPTWPGVLADFLAAGFNNNICTWLVSSGPSQIELVVIDWVRNWLGYPETSGGLLTSGSSAGSVEAFVAAREAAGHPERATVYMSDQSHYALVRAAMVVGVRLECIRKIPSDESFCLDMEALANAVAEDRAAGFSPILIAANAGTTGTGAVDPLEAMADYCEANSIWFHVDAAYGGFVCVTERGRKLMQGIERADSVTLDAHKWFFQPYEASILMVKDLRTLEDVFGMRPDILQDTIWGANHPNIANRGFQLSRSFRALKIWMSVQTFGMAAFRKSVLNGLELAEQAEAYIRESSYLENLNPVTLSAVCFRFNPSDFELDETAIEKINRTVLARVFWEDNAFISSTLLRNVFALRICIVNHDTTWDDVRETLEVVEKFGTEALESS